MEEDLNSSFSPLLNDVFLGNNETSNNSMLDGFPQDNNDTEPNEADTEDLNNTIINSTPNERRANNNWGSRTSAEEQRTQDNKKRNRTPQNNQENKRLNTGNMTVRIKAAENQINLLNKNHCKLLKDILKQDNSIRQSQIKTTTDSIIITCENSRQINKLLELTTLDNTHIKVAYNQRNESQSSSQLMSVVIHKVPLNITIEEIIESTGCTRAKRFTRRNEGALQETETVKLEFESTPPVTVFIGIRYYKTKTYIPLPTRCLKCQVFGHTAKQCKGKTTCPRCAKDHTFINCPLNATSNSESNDHQQYHLKCRNCGGEHSSAYRKCPVFLESVEAKKIQIRDNITYADAVKKVRTDTNIPTTSNSVNTYTKQRMNSIVINQDPKPNTQSARSAITNTENFSDSEEIRDNIDNNAPSTSTGIYSSIVNINQSTNTHNPAQAVNNSVRNNEILPNTNLKDFEKLLHQLISSSITSTAMILSTVCAEQSELIKHVVNELLISLTNAITHFISTH